MVRLRMTAAMVRAIEHCSSRQLAGWPLPQAESEPSLEAPRIGNPITHGQVMDLAMCLRRNAATSREDMKLSYTLDELLRGSEVYIEPPPPKPQPSSEYQALMARLRAEEEARAYERMTRPTAAAPGPIGDVPIEEDEVTYADVNRQVAVIFNVVLSIVACSAALWMAARHWSTPTRLGLSMAGGGLVGVAEVVIYAGYLRRIGEAKQRERKQVERKEVISTWTTETQPLVEAKVAPEETVMAGLRQRKPA